MKHFLSLITTALIFIAPPIGAQQTCVNDKSGKKGAQNQDINKSLAASQDPLKKAFQKHQWGLKHDMEYLAACDAGGIQATALKTLDKDIKKITATQSRVKQIKVECIEASLQREVGNVGYSCSGGTSKRFENAGASSPCLNRETVDYLHFALNQALQCMSDGRSPIDPRFILKKINNETAFNFYIAYSGGVGIGQLTSIPVKEIAGWKEDGELVEGNGSHILEDLRKSQNPACAPFKEVVKNDFLQPPPRPGAQKNYCTWVNPGTGIARSLIYSLGYYVHVRDNIVKPALQSRSPKLAQNPDVVNYMTLVAYGPDGPSEAKSLIRRLRLSNASPPGETINRIIRSNAYVKQTESKMTELLQELNPEKAPTPADKKGDTCLK